MNENISFDSLHLHVGIRLQVLTVKDVKPIAYFSTLIGYVRDEYLIVKIPQVGKNALSVREGDKLTVRVFSGLVVGVFNVTVLRILMQPVFYMHVSFPDVITGSRLRSAMRVKVELPGKLVFGTETKSNADVSLVDLSAVGALVKSEVEVGAEGDVVELDFTMNNAYSGTETRIATKAVIRSVQMKPTSEGESASHAYGLEFTGLEPTDELVLENFTYETILSDRRNII